MNLLEALLKFSRTLDGEVGLNPSTVEIKLPESAYFRLTDQLATYAREVGIYNIGDAPEMRIGHMHIRKIPAARPEYEPPNP